MSNPANIRIVEKASMGIVHGYSVEEGRRGNRVVRRRG